MCTEWSGKFTFGNMLSNDFCELALWIMVTFFSAVKSCQPFDFGTEKKTVAWRKHIHNTEYAGYFSELTSFVINDTKDDVMFRDREREREEVCLKLQTSKFKSFNRRYVVGAMHKLRKFVSYFLYDVTKNTRKKNYFELATASIQNPWKSQHKSCEKSREKMIK